MRFSFLFWVRDQNGQSWTRNDAKMTQGFHCLRALPQPSQTSLPVLSFIFRLTIWISIAIIKLFRQTTENYQWICHVFIWKCKIIQIILINSSKRFDTCHQPFEMLLKRRAFPCQPPLWFWTIVPTSIQKPKSAWCRRFAIWITIPAAMRARWLHKKPATSGSDRKSVV